jgi:hypothetical protein
MPIGQIAHAAPDPIFYPSSTRLQHLSALLASRSAATSGQCQFKQATPPHKPHVTATIEPEMWAIDCADIVVANSANAVAYDIRYEFDPPPPAA